MSKKVCIIVDIDDKAFEVMHGGANGLSLIKPTGEEASMVPGAIMVTFMADLTIESGKMMHADAIGLMLLAEKQRGGFEDHPDLFTTKE